MASQAADPPCAQQPLEPPSNLGAIAQRAIDVYLLSKQKNGEMGGIGWWQTANGYTAIALHDIWADSRRNYHVLAEAIRHCERRHRGLINEYNDDTLWWALLCLHVYHLGKDNFFLDQAKAIWHHVEKNFVCRKGQVKFRDSDMEGACYWTSNEGEEQLNVITTGLFAELSIRLMEADATITTSDPRPSDFHRMPNSVKHSAAARCSLDWILRYRYEDSLVLDNILIKKQEAQDWTFTYITGVTLGVCALLYELTREVEYFRLACSMAREAMQRPIWVDDNGVLTESDAYGKHNHNPEQNSDAVGFKAILIRHLAVLYDAIERMKLSCSEAQDVASSIKKFINVNLQNQLERNTNGNGQYGPWWNGPFEMPTSHSQMAVLDVMAAAVRVNAPS